MRATDREHIPEELLQLVQRLLEAALTESRTGGEQLAAAVAGIKTRLTEMEVLVMQLAESDDEDDRIIRHYVLLQALKDARQEASEAVMAMQSHDRVVQRVENVRDTLQEVIAWQARLHPAASSTSGLYRAVGEQFTMEEERDLFDEVRQGTRKGA